MPTRAWRPPRPSSEDAAHALSRLRGVVADAGPPPAAKVSSYDVLAARQPAPAGGGGSDPEAAARLELPQVPAAHAPVAGVASALAGALADRLPPAVRGGRLDPTRHGAVGLAVVSLIAVVVTGALVLRARPAPVAVPAAPRAERVHGSPAASPTPSPVMLVVDVAGKVLRPGVIALPAGSRVGDAVRAAGGPVAGASTGLLNLARKLTDGEQVVVGVEPPPGAPAGNAAGAAASTGGKVDLNAATADQLEGLPGVGPVLAQRIVDWRQQHGPFRSVDQLREVSGIGERKFAELRDQVIV